VHLPTKGGFERGGKPAGLLLVTVKMVDRLGTPALLSGVKVAAFMRYPGVETGVVFDATEGMELGVSLVQPLTDRPSK